MNTEREAFEKLIKPVIANIAVSDKKYEYGVASILTAFDMVGNSSLANKPKAEHDGIVIGGWQLKYSGRDWVLREVYDNQQKRIEELEAVISKKDEALTNLLKEAKVLAILAHKHHAADCSYADVLPTGIGTWGCSCGLDSIILDGELMNDFQYESALALKAGDAQAPKEGWNEAIEKAAVFLENQKYSVFQPLRTYTANEHVDSIKSAVISLVKGIRALKTPHSQVNKPSNFCTVNNADKSTCQLHNLFCNYPECCTAAPTDKECK